MLDTVILTVPSYRFQILKPERFSPHARFLGMSGPIRCINNATANEKRSGIYLPKLTAISRKSPLGLKTSMMIEFSVPKLLHGNNLEEMGAEDAGRVFEALSMRLATMGVQVSDLKQAEVTTLHPSKNIILQDGYTASSVIQELKRINVSRKMDFTRDSYRNYEHSLQIYSSAHSLVIYDKIKDLDKPRSRSIDPSAPVASLPWSKTGLQVLRIEARFSKRSALNAALKAAGLKQNPVFAEVLRPRLCQKLLQAEWNKHYERNAYLLFEGVAGPKSALKALLRDNPGIRAKEAIYLVGLRQLSRDGDGITELRSLLEAVSGPRTWYRFARDLERLRGPNDGNGGYAQNWLLQIRSQLEGFVPYRLADSDVKKSKLY